MKAIYLSLLLLFVAVGCSQKPAAARKESKVMFQTVPYQQAILLQSGKNRTACAICGMHLPTFYRTNHAADTKYGTRQYCSLHCLVQDNELNKTDLRNVRVVDAKTLRFIPALKAWYVVGSRKPATMSRISKYAFASKKEAEAFAKAYGGKVMGFYDAYGVAIKDFTKAQ